jgi:hypothetical protein
MQKSNTGKPKDLVPMESLGLVVMFIGLRLWLEASCAENELLLVLCVLPVLFEMGSPGQNEDVVQKICAGEAGSGGFGVSGQ